jgi:hypothetical protein
MKVKQKVSLREGESPPAGRIALPDSPSKPFNLRDLIIVLVIAWAARLAFMLFVPPGARCFDAFSWESIAKILEAGENPYQVTTLLNWPPLWMQLIFCLSKVATVLGVTFFRVLQIFLILVESAVVILLIKLIQEVAPTAHVRKIVIIGLALNPIAVLLVCQHCNFDVLVALWLMLFMNSLLRYNRANNLGDWLSACLFLGLGILTKTVPFILIPMLAGGFRQATASFRFLGSVLLLGPVALGMSIIYVLAPADVTTKVLGYRSISECFGITGLFHIAGADKFVSIPNILFYGLLVAGMTLSWNLFWRRQCIGSRETVLYAALILAAIPSLGPGYAPQYIYWFMPFLVATYAFFNGQWRVVLAGFALISACTYLVEYALLPEFGYNFLYLWDPSRVPGGTGEIPYVLTLPVWEEMQTETGHTLLRFPIFIAYLTLLAFGVRILFRNIPNLLNIRVLKGFYSVVILALLVLSFGVIGNLTESKPENGNKSNESGLPSKEAVASPEAVNNLAWELATSSDANIRDGTLAVKLAERVCRQTDYRETIMIGTLAAAYAEAGRFDEAISTGQKACALASELGETNLLKRNQELVTLYQAHQPYHEPLPGPDDFHHLK